MQNLFNRSRPDRDAVRQIKELISEGFGLPDTTTLSVAELRCHEPGCPPIETVITAPHKDGSVQDWRKQNEGSHRNAEFFTGKPRVAEEQLACQKNRDGKGQGVENWGFRGHISFSL